MSREIAKAILSNHIDEYFDKNKETRFEDIPNEVFINAMIEYNKEMFKLDTSNIKCCDHYEPASTKHSDLYIDTNTTGQYIDIYIEYCKSCGDVNHAYE